MNEKTERMYSKYLQKYKNIAKVSKENFFINTNYVYLNINYLYKYV